ncbi:MAG: hypothetical protein ABI871_03865 [Chthoniobacterales bacterium]
MRTRTLLQLLAASVLPFLLYACGSTAPLPAYESPRAKTDFQHVRTTAYTHTESDHLQYGNRNALGGELHAAGVPGRRAENVRRALPVDDDSDLERVSYSASQLQPFSLTETPSARIGRTNRRSTFALPRTVGYGSAAADWSRWPAGTVFRLLSTGQVYKVDDYGWALAGRNTIDLYMSTAREMNTWGVRQEPIQILQWGDSQESLRLLQSHQGYKHIRRMVYELEGRADEAATLQ